MPPKRPRWRPVLWAVAALATLCRICLWPAAALAHPLGNFTVNRYARLEADGAQVKMRYVVDMAEIPAYQERQRIDTNHDGTINPAEKFAYLQQQVPALVANLHLDAGGASLHLAPAAQELTWLPGQGGLQTMRLVLQLTASLPSQPAWSVHYRDDNYSGRLGWQEVVVQAGPDVTLLASTAPSQDLSQELRHYPADMLQSPPALTSASFSFRPGPASAGDPAVVGVSGVGATNRTGVPLLGRGPDRFADLIVLPVLGPLSLVMTLLAALVWGAFHALTPGHGKTIVAAYLAGSRGTVRHAVFLGLTTTITHTAGVFALGFVTLVASQFIVPDRLYPWLEVLSGVLVVAIGLSLLVGRILSLPLAHTHGHQHGKAVLRPVTAGGSSSIMAANRTDPAPAQDPGSAPEERNHGLPAPGQRAAGAPGHAFTVLPQQPHTHERKHGLIVAQSHQHGPSHQLTAGDEHAHEHLPVGYAGPHEALHTHGGRL